MTGDEDSEATERIRAKTGDEDMLVSVCATAAVTAEHVCVEKRKDSGLKYCFGKSESHRYGLSYLVSTS